MNLYQIISRRFSVFTKLFLLTVILSATIQAQSSGVDLSFNATPSRESAYVGNFVLQPDGKILILGGTFVVNGVAKNQIVRLNSDGSSDNSFNCAACDFNIGSAVVQPDGKIIVAGSAVSPVNGSYPAIVKRLNSDGSIDNSFVLPFDAQAGSSARVWAIQPDGKVIVSLSIFTKVNAPYPFDRVTSYVIYRLNVNGSLDNTFRTITSRSENTISSYIY
ncbi:MAG: delta-60 repeat domain-containing protein [Pyrinomonadaceae bacterium]